jgi:aminodeoxyfutalosine deaminase
MSFRTTLQARYVFPIVGEPIENGFVSVEGSRIAAVGKTPPGGERLDLGNVALLPGFVNAHAHLELSTLDCPLGAPGMGFVDWIRTVIDWRKNRLLDSASAIVSGLDECTRQGVTTLGNISQIDEPENAFESADSEGIRFMELIAPDVRSVPAVLDLWSQEFSRQQDSELASTWRPGLSPHAPYSIHPALLENVVGLSAARQIPLSTHLAESREEIELLADGAGPFREFLEDRKIFDPTAFPGGRRPLDYLQILSAASRALVIHGNYLSDTEIALLAENAQKMAVVYCPRTHAYFRHDPYPLEKMLAAGAVVALGTDSRASSPDLSLLAEMRFAARRYPHIGPERILQMATIDAARALGRSEEIGSLSHGKWANLAVVALPEESAVDPYRLLFDSAGSVVQTWYRGRPVWRSAPT